LSRTAEAMRVEIPEGTRGEWAVQQFKITKRDALYSMFSYRERHPTPGTYTRLVRGGTVVMSDTPAEIRDLLPIVWNAKGHVLLNGLGLGVALSKCLESDKVTRVTVVEKSDDVILLVGPHFKDPRVRIVPADAFEYKPPKGVRYGAVWHDIWDSICADNLPEMTRLHRKYGRVADWQGSWCRDQCERQR
jgi:hypothetical protein